MKGVVRGKESSWLVTWLSGYPVSLASVSLSVLGRSHVPSDLVGVGWLLSGGKGKWGVEHVRSATSRKVFAVSWVSALQMLNVVRIVSKPSVGDKFHRVGMV